MGCCGSTAAPSDNHDGESKRVNTEIVSSMKNAERLNKQEKKLLLLGTGSSGKSTLFKSLKIIKNEENAPNEIAESRHVIRQNCVYAILTLLKKSQELYDENPEQNGACLVNMDDEIVEAIQLVVNNASDSFSEVLDYGELQKLGVFAYSHYAYSAPPYTFTVHVHIFMYIHIYIHIYIYR